MNHRNSNPWLEHTKLKMRSIASTLGLFVLPFLVLKLSSVLGRTREQSATSPLGIALVMALAALYFTLRLTFWKCPGCGKTFHDPFKKQLRHPWLSKACAWCGLRLGEQVGSEGKEI